MGFEEKITTENKEPTYECLDMPSYTCQKCGNEQQIASNYDLEDVECYECEVYGEWKDELAEVIAKKIDIIENDVRKANQGKKDEKGIY